MKNKLMVLALAVALLVGLVPPSSAMANESEEYEFEINGSTYMFNLNALTITQESGGEQYVFDSQFEQYLNSGYKWLLCYTDASSADNFVLLVADPTYNFAYGKVKKSASGSDYHIITTYRGALSSRTSVFGEVVSSNDSASVAFKEYKETSTAVSSVKYYYGVLSSNYDLKVVLSSHDVACIKDSPTAALWYYPWYRVNSYTFAEFCEDVGIVNTLSPYAQDEKDMYIVQESRGEYTYRVLQVPYNVDSLYYPYYYANDVSSYIGLGNATTDSQSVEINEYGYSESAGAWIKLDAKVGPVVYDSPIVELLDMYNGEIVYTNYEIFDGVSQNSVKYNVTEKAEPAPTPTPTVAPTTAPTPTVVPPVSAGQATVINNRSGVYEEPSSQTQLQHYLYEGALVYVIEVLENGWYYVRYEVGGLNETGYILAENVSYDSDNGTSGESVTSDYQAHVSDLLGIIGSVPLMIGAVFSFLPPWCLSIVGVAFTALIGVIAWKVARG